MQYILTEAEYLDFKRKETILEQLKENNVFSELRLYQTARGSVRELNIYNETDTIKVLKEEIHALREDNNKLNEVIKENDRLMNYPVKKRFFSL